MAPVYPHPASEAYCRDKAAAAPPSVASRCIVAAPLPSTSEAPPDPERLVNMGQHVRCHRRRAGRAFFVHDARSNPKREPLFARKYVCAFQFPDRTPAHCARLVLANATACCTRSNRQIISRQTILNLWILGIAMLSPRDLGRAALLAGHSGRGPAR